MRTISMLFCLAAAGCASGTANVPAAGADSVVLVDHLPGPASMLRRVSVVACATDMTSPRPTAAEAQPLLRQKAAAIGATGILRPKYEPAGLFDGCGLVPALKASGIAFRLAP